MSYILESNKCFEKKNRDRVEQYTMIRFGMLLQMLSCAGFSLCLMVNKWLAHSRHKYLFNEWMYE